MCPLSRDHEQRDSEFLSSVRSAIANRDHPLALRLLRQLAEQGTSAETVDYAVGDALVATARGARRGADDRAALAGLERVQQARDQVLALLERTEQLACPHCRRARRHKDADTIVVRTLFGTLHLLSPRSDRRPGTSALPQGADSAGAHRHTESR